MQWLISLFTGGLIDKLANIYAKHKDSAVESERIKADVAKKQLDGAIEAQKLANQVRLATAGFMEMRVITAALGGAFAFHACAVVICTTFNLGPRWGLWIPALPSPFDQWEGAIVLSFFGVQLATKGINGLVAAFLARR
jgi:hypothetical protein